MRKIYLTAIIGASLTVNANSPYLSQVYDFLPAPGQFVNVVPEVEGTTQADVIAAVTEQLCGDECPGMISLGSFGGYVIVGFDHPVVNVAGEYDFKIFGNAFASSGYTDCGSSEPGIVMVSVDTNGDGVPNDEWYELAGSDYAKCFHNYEITYYRPNENKDRVTDPNDNTINDATYIRWTSNNPDATEGYVYRNVFHTQSYWPEWYDGDTMTFTGTLMPKNGVNTGELGAQNWLLYFFDWGYVDNRPNADDPGFNIDWAVDKNGTPVHLNKIDFIKIYSAQQQYCGWLGETSTEVCGGLDLHPDAVAAVADITAPAEAPAEYFNLNGTRTANPGSGIYIVRRGSKVTKEVRY